MKSFAPIYGFHGTTLKSAKNIIDSGFFDKSAAHSEWLGHGVYFWENDPLRALEWAKRRNPGKAEKDLCVIGALIDSARCLDLSTRYGVRQLKIAYDILAEKYASAGLPLPKNSGGAQEKNRRLDCLVLNTFFDAMSGKSDEVAAAVKSPFFEGKPAYEGGFFYEQTHTQICVSDQSCILATFFVRDVSVWEKQRDETSSIDA